ncbi:MULTISPECIES: NAD(P)-dependent alcohol dehydrogenase [Sphingobacterium]|uniref:NAD(P)-dependent alcohol dehydrogenase n=1 Tax=Sphingobacterium TaxID=28453 RepID=UPI001969E426|nr:MULTISPECIES: NAD(P)-dependent alcohol dehydrogenase [unclassified Sphingobacterium]
MQKMKAVVCRQYGPPEVLQIVQVDKPLCRDNEVLVRVMATSVNSGDVKIRGLVGNVLLQLIMRLALGFSKPRKPILGTVYAGVIEQTGKNTNRFKKGDRVFGITGFKFGTYAEYVSVKDKSVVDIMPANATFEEAAALPFGWHTALYFFEKSRIKKCKKPAILVYGSTGSVGVAAVQLAQHLDADLTVVCGSAGKALMESLHVKSVILYDREDFSTCQKRFDFIFDAVGKVSFGECKKLLNPNGTFLSVNGFDIATETVGHLQLIKELFEKRKCKAVIDKMYAFKEIVSAHRYVDDGRKKGNVVIVMDDSIEIRRPAVPETHQ